MRIKLFEKIDRWALYSALGLSVLLLAACASTTQTPQYISNAESAVQQAKAVNAEEVAPEDLNTAQSKLEDATIEARLDDHREGQNLANEAIINAQLAEAKASMIMDENRIEQLRYDVEELRRQVQNDTSQ